jgi:hypothetical protein
MKLPKKTVKRIRSIKAKDLARQVAALQRIADRQAKAVIASVHVPAVPKPDMVRKPILKEVF